MKIVVVIASLSMFAFCHAMTANNPYEYVTRCKPKTEPCIVLGCGSDLQSYVNVPFTYHYSCCNGKLFDERKYVCSFYSSTGSTLVEKCDPCTQFKCNDGGCQLKHWTCDGNKDCTDGSDEVGCGHCFSHQFRCKRDRNCIHALKVCDKQNDCSDGSDEFNCQTKAGTKCSVGRFRCRNDKCIPGASACNGRNDCTDGSDENGSCRIASKRDEILSFKGLVQNDDGSGGNAVDAAEDTI